MGVENVFHGIAANQRYTYYTLEVKKTHETKWGFPDGELFPIAELTDGFGKQMTAGWGVASWDNLGYVIEPWAGPGNSYKPVFKESHDETHAVWSATGRNGWWTYAYAEAGAKRLREASAALKLDSRDGYNKVLARKKYDVRIVRVTVAKVVEVVEPEEDAPCGV